MAEADHDGAVCRDIGDRSVLKWSLTKDEFEGDASRSETDAQRFQGREVLSYPSPAEYRDRDGMVQ